CRHTHAAIDGALGVLRTYHPDPEEVEKIEVRMYGQGVKGHDYTDIPAPNAGKMSTPFCIGLALQYGSAGITAFTEENVQNETIMRLCRATTVEADPEMTAMVPKKRPAHVSVIMKDGTVYEKQVDYALGEPENPMSMEAFMEKFMDLSAYGGKSERAAGKIADAILHHEGTVRELTELLQ
ncbi:MAG: MmgE/PrpD family protein, partial [Lachnospiraceae bacterium]|nr:MmgE/PrpD family protein [Lachnospiraceae bacterium]